MNPAVFEVDIYDGEEQVEKLTFASSSAEDTNVWVHELNKCFGAGGKGTAAGSAAAGSGDTMSLLLAKKTVMNPAEVQKIRELMAVGLHEPTQLPERVPSTPRTFQAFTPLCLCRFHTTSHRPIARQSTTTLSNTSLPPLGSRRGR